jgi:hypothetical protein
MEFAAVKLDTILSEVFVVDVDGMKFMIKVWEFVEFLVIKKEFIILPKENVSAYLISMN